MRRNCGGGAARMSPYGRSPDQWLCVGASGDSDWMGLPFRTSIYPTPQPTVAAPGIRHNAPGA